jgi:lipoprotein-anchoring transpeptidase ErfK/SrfK
MQLAAQRSEAQTTCKRVLLALALILAERASAQSASSNVTPIPGRPERLVLVSIPDRKLAVLENGKVIRTFPVAVGAAQNPSPTGEFRIVHRLVNPAYYHPGLVIPPGRNNPLGRRWVGLNQKDFGIHGTNEPSSIGKAASHGCIRMRNRDIEQLFGMVARGDRVSIRGERDEQVAQIFGSAVRGVSTQAQPTEMSQVSGGQ